MKINYKKLLTIFFLGSAMMGISGLVEAQDVRLFVRHDVTDYSVWKKGYDDFSGFQKSQGVFSQSVWQSIDNPNEVTVIHDFHSMEKAKSFANSQDLKEKMKKIGVKGVPQIWYTNKGAK